jgi:hypothetical protein
MKPVLPTIASLILLMTLSCTNEKKEKRRSVEGENLDISHSVSPSEAPQANNGAIASGNTSIGEEDAEKSAVRLTLNDANSAYWSSNSKSKSDNAFISSLAAVEDYTDTSKRFIRSAELKFQVKSVIRSTYDIEEIAKRAGGFVIYTNLSSAVDYIKTTPVSDDSTLESKYYTVRNSITLRVPNTKLDNTLKQIAENIYYLDFRTIKADDVALKILQNRLAHIRAIESGDRVEKAIDSRGKKLNETTRAEDLLSERKKQADESRIANLTLENQINYSTINLTIYQRQSVMREMIANDLNIKQYEPGFGKKLSDALKSGWHILETIILFFFNLWALALLVIPVIFLFIKYRRRNKK